MRRHVLLPLLLALALATAGCLAGGDDGSADPAATGPADADAADVDGNATADDQANATTEPQPSWNRTIREGSVTGTNAVIVSQNDDSNETFHVRDGALNVTLNVTADGGELSLNLYPGDCENEGEVTGDEACSETLATEDGEATWTTDDPAPGQWTVYLYKGDPGHGTVDYGITLDVLEPPAR